MFKYAMVTLVTAAFVFGMILMIVKTPAQTENATEEQTVSIPEVTLDEPAAQAVYKQSCIACHGDQLQGGPIAPKLADVGATMSLEQIYKQIENGGGGMPPFQGTLTDEEIANLATWLAQQK